MSQMVDMLQCDNDDHRQQMDTVTQANVEKDERISQLKRNLTDLEALVETLQSRSNGAENVVIEDQLNRRLCDLTLELKDKEEQTRKAEGRARRADKELSAEKERAAVVRQGMKEELSLSEKDVACLTAEVSSVEAAKDAEIAALTDSMRQANDAVRTKALDATALSQQLGEERGRSAEQKRALLSLQRDVDDYILRVNEQAEEIGILKERREKERGATSSLKKNSDQVVVKQECLSADEAEVDPRVDAPTADDGTELSTVKKHVTTLETKLEESEYKHQMSCRQLRREKTQLEKLLRETETALTEAQELIDEAEFRSHESSIDAEQSVSKQVVDAERKVSQVTEAMRDLETCLHSSKATEEVLCGEVESLRERCRHLQEAVYKSEDGEKPDGDGLVVELEKCRTEISDGEKERVLLAAAVEEMKAELGVTENRSEKCRREAEKQRACLVAQLEEVKAKLTVTETTLNRQQKALDKAESAMSDLDSEFATLKERHGCLETSLSHKNTEISELQTELGTLQTTISENDVKFNEISSDKTALQESVSEKENLIEQLRGKLCTVEEDADKKSEGTEKRLLEAQRDLEEARKLTKEAEVSCHEKEVELVRLHKIEDSVGSLEAQIVDKTDKCTCLDEKLTELTATAAELRDEITIVKEEKKNSETRVNEDKKNSDEDHVTRLTALKEEHSNELSSLREELARKGDVDELQARVDELQTKVTELESELARSQSSAEQSGKHLATSKREMELLDEQVGGAVGAL